MRINRRHARLAGFPAVWLLARPFTDALRGLAAAGVLLAATVHLDQYAAGFSGIPTIGPLFLLDFVGGLVLGVWMLVHRHWLPTFLAAGYGGVTVLAYWVSVVHGLFGVHETVGGWAVVLAETAEYAALVFGLSAAYLLWRERAPRTALPGAPRSGRVTATGR
jgi:hypothetical protein